MRKGWGIYSRSLAKESISGQGNVVHKMSFTCLCVEVGSSGGLYFKSLTLC